MTQTQLIFNLANLACYAFAAVGAFVIIFKRPKNLAEEMRDCINTAIADLRREFRDELKATEERWQKQCVERNGKAVSAYNELYNLDRQRESELGLKLDAINHNLSQWQRSIESKLGNHDGRINNLEHNQ